MKDKKWVVIIVLCLLVLVLAFVFLTGKKYTVTFDTDGGNSISSVKVKKNSVVSKPVNPNKEGYNFVSWTLDGKEYDFSTKVTKNITLKATWEAKEVVETVYNIILNNDGKTETIKVANGKITGLPSPSKEGYNFIGWFDGSNKVSVGDTISKDVTLTAKWEKVEIKEDPKTSPEDEIVKYTVTFNSDGGSSVKKQTVVEGKKASKPANPTKKSYKFVGWYLGNTEYTFNETVTSNITLTAKWEYAPKLSYELILDPGTIVNQAKLYITADGKRVAGICDITMNTGKVVTKEIPASGLAINKDKVDKVTNIRLK